MGLPNVIEIVPAWEAGASGNHRARFQEHYNRALILAALTDGQTTLRGALWSEDTQVMVEALQKLGFEVNVEPDANDIAIEPLP